MYVHKFWHMFVLHLVGDSSFFLILETGVEVDVRPLLGLLVGLLLSRVQLLDVSGLVAPPDGPLQAVVHGEQSIAENILEKKNKELRSQFLLYYVLRTHVPYVHSESFQNFSKEFFLLVQHSKTLYFTRFFTKPGLFTCFM